MTAEIKDDIIYTFAENVRFRRHVDSVYSSHCNCECWTCYYYINYVNKYGHAFFRDSREQHYNQLKQHIFLPLANLQTLEFQHSTDEYKTLSRLKIKIPTSSGFYSAGRRHLTKETKKQIDELSKLLKEYNSKTDSLNPPMTSRINGIVNSPIPSQLSEKYVPSIFQIIRDAFEDVVLNTDREIEYAFRSYDMQKKITGAYGFNGEKQKAINIVKNIEANSQIRQDLQTMRSLIIDIKQLANDISNEASGIIHEIVEKRYREKRWCCPTLIRELWHYV